MTQGLPPGFVLDTAPPAARPVNNDPIVKARDPYKDSAEQRAIRDQQMQEQRFRLEQQRDQRTAQKDQQGSVEQGKSAGFLLRALQANDAYEAQEIGARSYIGQKAAEFAPDVLNSLPESVGNSPRRQVSDANQKDFIAATLRYESGAAIPAEELENQRRMYFPMPGDSPEAIAAKKRLRETAIAALMQSSGPLATPTYEKFQAMPEAQQAPEADPLLGLTGTVTDDRPNEDPNAIQVTRGGPGGGAWSAIGAGVGDIVEGGLNNTVGLITNPVSSVLGRAMGYEGYTGDIGQAVRDALQLPEGNQTAAAINQAAAGGFSLGALSSRGGVALGNQALRTFGNNPLLDAATGATAAASAETAKNMGAGPGGQAAAALVGGFAPSGLMAGRNALATFTGRTPPRGPAPDMNVVRAGERQDIAVRAPDAQPELRGDYAALESGEKSGPLIAQARAADAEAIDNRAVEVAGGTPYKPSENTAMGQRIQANARAGQEAVKGKAGAFYKRVEREAPGFVTPPTRTSTFIDAKIAELQARSPSGYAEEVNALKAMKSDLEKTGLSVETLQAQRETVGGRIGDNVQARTRADKTFTEVLDVAAGELHDAMKATNPQAAAILKRADAKWSQYKRLQKEVTTLFLGKRDDMTPEASARALNAAAKNNYEALRKFMTIASEEDKADFAATFARNWGTDQRGNFSPAAFAKSMEKVGDRTLDALVGVDGRKALRDLQILANAKTDAMSRMAPSGKAISGVKAGLRTAILSAFGLSQGGFVGAVVLPIAGKLISNVGEERAARLMLNPDFTKWLRAMPEATNPRAINAYFDKLKVSAAKSQIVANDIEAFSGAVLDVFARSPGRAAAQDEAPSGGEPPQQ